QLGEGAHGLSLAGQAVRRHPSPIMPPARSRPPSRGVSPPSFSMAVGSGAGLSVDFTPPSCLGAAGSGLGFGFGADMAGPLRGVERRGGGGVPSPPTGAERAAQSSSSSS